MTLSNELALKLRLAKAYKNCNSMELSQATNISKTTVTKYCNGDFGQTITNIEECMKALGFELEIKMRRVQE